MQSFVSGVLGMIVRVVATAGGRWRLRCSRAAGLPKVGQPAAMAPTAAHGVPGEAAGREHMVESGACSGELCGLHCCTGQPCAVRGSCAGACETWPEETEVEAVGRNASA